MDETGGVSINELLCGCCCCFIVVILGAAQEMLRGKFNLYTVGGVSGRYVFSITLPFSLRHPSIHPSCYPWNIVICIPHNQQQLRVCIYAGSLSNPLISFFFILLAYNRKNRNDLMMMKQLGERSPVTPFTVVLVLVLGDVYEMFHGNYVCKNGRHTNTPLGIFFFLFFFMYIL